MNLTQTLAEGLKRQFKVVVPTAQLSARFEKELEDIRSRVNLKGFRQGKVPAGHVRRLHGKSIMADVVQKAVEDAQKKIAEEVNARLAGEPQIRLPEDKDVIDQIFDCKADLDFSVDIELLPEFTVQDHSSIRVVRSVVEVSEEEVNDAVKNIASRKRPFSARAENETAQKDDKVTIDFVGSIDGVDFPGGSAENADLILGSGQFIPGFEDQLIGAKVGDEPVVKVTFPSDYQNAQLAGKAAEFKVKVNQIQAPGELVIDDDLAKEFQIESLEKMRESVQGMLEQEIAERVRMKMKRQLLDALDGLYSFDLPQSLVEGEFQAVWRQVEADMTRSGQSFGEGEEEKSRAEYLAIAHRRVRLGLLLAEIGRQAEIKIEDRELTQALFQRAQQFPGQERQIFEYYRKNPEALAEIRAPLFEEKAIDVILAGVNVIEEKTTREELMKDDDEEATTKEKATDVKPKKAKSKKADQAEETA